MHFNLNCIYPYKHVGYIVPIRTFLSFIDKSIVNKFILENMIGVHWINNRLIIEFLIVSNKSYALLRFSHATTMSSKQFHNSLHCSFLLQLRYLLFPFYLNLDINCPLLPWLFFFSLAIKSSLDFLFFYFTFSCTLLLNSFKFKVMLTSLEERVFFTIHHNNYKVLIIRIW